MKGIHPYKGDGGVPVANEEDKGKLTTLHGEPVHVLPDALVDGEQTALSPDLSSRVTPRQVNAVQSELTSLFEGLVSAAEKQSGDDSTLKWDVSGVQNLKAAVTEYTDAVAGAVAAAASTGGGGADPALVARVTTLETRATAIEAVDTTQNTRLGALETRANGVDTSLAGHETRIVALETSGGGAPSSVPIENIESYDRRIILAPSDVFLVDGGTGSDPAFDDYDHVVWGTITNPYKTIQGAIDHISMMYAGRALGSKPAVIIRMAPGSYGGFSITPSAISSWVIEAAVPGVVITSPVDVDTAKVKIKGLTIAPTTGDSVTAIHSAAVVIESCKIKAAEKRSGVTAHGSQVSLHGDMQIYGSSSYRGGRALYSTASGVIHIGRAGGVTPADCSIHITDNWDNLIYVTAGGYLALHAHATVHTTPAANGRKYLVESNAVFFAAGRTPQQLPGNQAGIARKGGQFT